MGASDGCRGDDCQCRRYLLRRRLPSARPPRGLTRRALSVPVGGSIPGASGTVGPRPCRDSAPTHQAPPHEGVAGWSRPRVPLFRALGKGRPRRGTRGSLGVAVQWISRQIRVIRGSCV